MPIRGDGRLQPGAASRALTTRPGAIGSGPTAAMGSVLFWAEVGQLRRKHALRDIETGPQRNSTYWGAVLARVGQKACAIRDRPEFRAMLCGGWMLDRIETLAMFARAHQY